MKGYENEMKNVDSVNLSDATRRAGLAKTHIDGLWSFERNWSSMATALSNCPSSNELSTIWRRYLPISGTAVVVIAEDALARDTDAQPNGRL